MSAEDLPQLLVLAGQRLEQFLAPGRELELLDRQGRPQVTLALDAFAIRRDPAGRPEQFTSQLRLIPPPADAPSASGPDEATSQAPASDPLPSRRRSASTTHSATGA